MWDSVTTNMILNGILETVYMTVVSTFFGYLLGLPMGILLTTSDKNGLKPNPFLYKVLDAISNVVRSVPFLILLILLIPVTRQIVGKSYGTTATIVPLVISAPCGAAHPADAAGAHRAPLRVLRIKRLLS